MKIFELPQDLVAVFREAATSRPRVLGCMAADPFQGCPWVGIVLTGSFMCSGHLAWRAAAGKCVVDE